MAEYVLIVVHSKVESVGLLEMIVPPKGILTRNFLVSPFRMMSVSSMSALSTVLTDLACLSLTRAAKRKERLKVNESLF